MRYKTAREPPRGGDDSITITLEIGTVKGAVATWSLHYTLSWIQQVATAPCTVQIRATPVD